MARPKLPDPRTARVNRRGCFIILAVLALLLAALAFVGLSAGMDNSANTDIPTVG